MILTDITVATGQHNRLVIAAPLTVERHFKCTKITTKIGPTIFVVKSSAADGALKHDIERRDNSLRFAVVVFPGLDKSRNAQIRNTETGEASLGFRTSTNCTFIANFTPRTSTCTRKGRNRGGVIMGLDLHQQMYRFLMIPIGVAIAGGEEPPTRAAGYHRCIV